MIEASLHLLVLDMGLVSITSTISPTVHSLFSSCTCSFILLFITLPNSGCLKLSSMATTMVLSILVLTTLPVRVLRRFLSIASLMTYLLSLRILLVKNSHHTSDVLLDIFDLVGIVKLIDRMLEAKVEHPDNQKTKDLIILTNKKGGFSEMEISPFYVTIKKLY